MGRVGACGDNAAMESFFALLQRNVLDRRCWRTRQELRLAIVTWIETTYHRKRRQRRLGRLTPSSSKRSIRPLPQSDDTHPCVNRTGAVPRDRIRRIGGGFGPPTAVGSVVTIPHARAFLRRVDPDGCLQQLPCARA
ncbi:transposase [Rhodococcus rhodnii LMG 5362]|uniref:Transposase n=1 Tax=Rhodococcus rhodnii LMG 5362 TaxID=1273125 RepID=R7WKF1_9NOCA|nr:transposase [Rhodococcus rhodnii LMG 5362]